MPRTLRSFALVGFLLSAAASQEPDAEFVHRIRDLIVQLKDRNVTVRKTAEEELFALGFAALPLLRAEEAGLKGDLKQKVGIVIRRIERHRHKDIAVGNTMKVTLSATDRPVVDVLEDLQESTGVPIDRGDVPAGLVTTIEAKDLILWEAVDQICAGNGKLAWDVSEKGITVQREKYARPFMVAVSGYALILRPFHRHPPGLGSGDRDYLLTDAIIVGPPGAVPVAQFLTFDRLVDDKKTDLLGTPAGIPVKISIGEYQMMAEPDLTRPLYEVATNLLDAAPARGSTKVKTCTGQATIQVVLETDRRLEMRSKALQKGGRDSGYGLVLEIDTFDVAKDGVTMELSITDTRIGARREARIFYPQTRGKIVLRDGNGSEIPSEVERIAYVPGPRGKDGSLPTQETTRFKLQAALKDGATIGVLEVWEPTGIEEIKFPFEFTDVPMKKVK